MKKYNYFLIAIVMLISAISCQNENRNNRDKAATSITDATSDTTMRAQMYTSDVDLQGDEKLFLLDAINGSIFDIEAATMLERKTKNPLVKSFAKNIVTASTQVSKNLSLIAKGKGINPPTVQSEENLAKLTVLKTVSDELLDKTYIKLVTTSLAHYDMLFGKAATFKNKDIKTFAINALSETQKHHNEAVAIGKKLNVSNQNNGNDLL
jgi:predicted outer membrane protein